jgi:hypothetical protein
MKRKSSAKENDNNEKGKRCDEKKPTYRKCMQWNGASDAVALHRQVIHKWVAVRGV